MVEKREIFRLRILDCRLISICNPKSAIRKLQSEICNLKSLLALLNNPKNRSPDQFRSVLQIKLLLDAISVRLDRLDAQVQALGNLGGFDALADHAEDLQLAVGDDVERREHGLFLAGAAD